MAILENTVSAAARHPAATTLICGTLARLLSGFLLSLIVAAYRLYACVEIL